MARAGPTKRKGCSRLRQVGPNWVITQLVRKNSIATPPTPQMMATTAMTADGALLSLRKRKPAYITMKPSPGTTMAISIRQRNNHRLGKKPFGRLVFSKSSMMV